MIELLFEVDGVVYYRQHFYVCSHTRITVGDGECLSTLESLAFSLVFKCFLDLWKKMDEECLSLLNHGADKEKVLARQSSTLLFRRSMA